MLEFTKNADYFPVVFSILEHMGLFPHTSKRLKIGYVLLAAIHFLIFVVLVVTLEIWYMLKAPDGYILAVKTFGAVVYHIAAIIRVVHCIYYGRTYVELHQALNRKSFNFENFDFESLNDVELDILPDQNYENPPHTWRNKGIVNREVEENRENLRSIQNKIMKVTRIKSYVFGVVLVLLAYVSIFFSYTGSIIGATKVYFDSTKEIETKIYEVPYNSMQLIDMHSPTNFAIAVIYQGYSSIYLTTGFLLIDSLLQACLIHMTGQLEVIDVMLKRIRIDESVRTNPFKERIVNAQFVKCTEEIQHIITINDKLEKFLSMPLFLHFQFATYIMCSLIYALPEEKEPLKFYGFAVFGALGTIHPLTCCWNSQILIDKFGCLADAMYHIDFWGNSSTAFKRKLLFSMYRLQKQIVITIGKFSTMNLQYFILFLQKGYSLFTLFNNTKKTI